MRAATNARGLKILEGALKRATGDEPGFPAVQEYRDELIERIYGESPVHQSW
ncbi:hypothetical protein [Amycolatopsis sp. NPDC021455]|uniref:hypothetical protein n=1 Tax=Amycolatopsis sp. NPDC021455 TaxID=3154901 RepID=UPI0033DD574A